MFSLESHHGGNSNEYTQYTIFNIKENITPNYPESAAMEFFRGTQEGVQNSRGKRVISVQAIEVLLYVIREKKEYSVFPFIFSFMIFTKYLISEYQSKNHFFCIPIFA